MKVIIHQWKWLSTKESVSDFYTWGILHHIFPTMSLNHKQKVKKKSSGWSPFQRINVESDVNLLIFTLWSKVIYFKQFLHLYEILSLRCTLLWFLFIFKELTNFELQLLPLETMEGDF